jgi:hypothetical protein
MSVTPRLANHCCNAYFQREFTVLLMCSKDLARVPLSDENNPVHTLTVRSMLTLFSSLRKSISLFQWRSLNTFFNFPILARRTFLFVLLDIRTEEAGLEVTH